jgi:hypothetical protein
MTDIEKSTLYELIKAADQRRKEAVLAMISEADSGPGTDWTDLIVDEAADLDKRMRFVNRFAKLPKRILGTNVPVRSKGHTMYEQASYHSPLLFETAPELLGNNYAISSGLTAGSYYHPTYQWQRSITVKRWLIDTAPDGSRTLGWPDRLAAIYFDPNYGNETGRVDGDEFQDFAREYRATTLRTAREAGRELDPLNVLAEEVPYPDDMYVSVLGLIRICNKALHSRLTGPSDWSPMQQELTVDDDYL